MRTKLSWSKPVCKTDTGFRYACQVFACIKTFQQWGRSTLYHVACVQCAVDLHCMSASSNNAAFDCPVCLQDPLPNGRPDQSGPREKGHTTSSTAADTTPADQKGTALMLAALFGLHLFCFLPSIIGIDQILVSRCCMHVRKHSLTLLVSQD